MKYYVISFQNIVTGEIKEYYKCISASEIKKFAIEMVEKSNLNKEEVRIHIYELKEVIYNGEY